MPAHTNAVGHQTGDHQLNVRGIRRRGPALGNGSTGYSRHNRMDLSRPLLASLRHRLAANPQEHDHGPVQSHHILVRQSTDLRFEFCPWNRRDLIHHDAARLPQSVATCRFHRKSEQRGVSGNRR